MDLLKTNGKHLSTECVCRTYPFHSGLSRLCTESTGKQSQLSKQIFFTGLTLDVFSVSVGFVKLLCLYHGNHISREP